MPVVLNRQPVGLLGFFSIKNGGEYPQYLDQILQAGLDVRDLYEWQSNETFMSAPQAHVNGPVQWGPTGAIGSGAANLFHFNHISAWLSCTGVGAAGSVSIGFNDPSSGQYFPLTETEFAAQAVANTSHVKTVVARDFWLPQGYPLVVYGSNIAGAPLVALGYSGTFYRA